MNFEIIETARLILKGLSPQEMNSVFEKHSKPEIKKILGHRSEKDFEKEEAKYKKGYSCYNRSFMLFLITDKASEKIIGRCGIHNWNAEHSRAEIGYIMEDENYKRKGLMSEALAAVIEYGFTKLNLHRIEALVGTENIPSLRLMEKFNFTKEGLLRQHYYINNKYEDSIIFSKLQHEFQREK
jgi:ribosomal-protein-alanine N-acetyltransferase